MQVGMSVVKRVHKKYAYDRIVAQKALQTLQSLQLQCSSEFGVR